MATTIITITIIITGLVGAIGGNYTKRPIPRKVAWLRETTICALIDL